MKKRFPEFINKKVSLVLKDNTVVFGELKKVDNQTLYITNMRLKKIKLPMETVTEFFTDIDG